MTNPSNISLSEKYRLLKIIKKASPTRWEDIARCYGWVGGLGGGHDGDKFLKYVMVGIQTLNAEGFATVKILDLISFRDLKLTRKGKFFLVWYPIGKFVYWILAVGIVSAAAIKTLFME